ncbi:MAG: serine hydrolase domain-containing protein [Desulfopila sp.]
MISSVERLEGEVRETMRTVLAEGVGRGVMVGGVAGVAVSDRRGGEKLRSLCGHGVTDITSAVAVTTGTVYDLASLTKPLVTLLCTLYLAARQVVDLDMPLTALLPFSRVPEEKRALRLGHLLSHSSGLPAYKPYFVEALQKKKGQRKAFYLNAILRQPLLALPGTAHLYSDLGFILLGCAIEQLTGRSLDAQYRQTIVEPLGLGHGLWFPSSTGPGDSLEYAATEICPWTRKLLRGVVHDENCRVLGGVAGHAGLFGTVSAVLDLCMVLVRVWRGELTTPLFSTELLRRFLARQAGTTWAYGLDGPSARQSSSGRYFGPESFGHLGFTGTSLWLDMTRGVAVVLLTNRVHPSRNNQRIRQFRPLFHDAVMRALYDKDPVDQYGATGPADS